MGISLFLVHHILFLFDLILIYKTHMKEECILIPTA